ncbi:hypothetical protein B0T25DRAFT_306874 [Lasiosphaeria hispida]|uniref:Uncharacterized protein n=1 Tax=Lasiosphaeria hispida TaxID=260671 RepID=A0AAJ0M994_9PEZI|nr:hypothetical protein B0T25DRAFT_306874 [Lasiosphaeria hispida]
MTAHAGHSPGYTPLDATTAPRPSDASGLDTDSILSGPPPYTESTTFTPTTHLQIETAGKAALSFPLPLRPDPIPIFLLSTTTPGSSPPGPGPGPTYTSLRPTRRSGSCFLVPGAPGPSSDHPHVVPLSTTRYRFGPGRHPHIRLFAPGGAAPTPNPFLDHDDADHHSGDVDLSTWDAFDVLPSGLLTRAVHFRTRLGTFEWRYASRKERKAAGADSLLVLDRVVKIARARDRGEVKDEEVRTPVAQLVRNGEFRSEGSRASSAGNGGRLLVDWRGGEKGEGEMVLVLAVTTVLVMLKREVDRRRAQQIAIMAGAGGSG